MLLGVLQEGPAVSVVQGHPGAVVRVVRVLALAELDQDRVDLHRVHVLRALGQRHRDVVTRAGPDDQDVLQRRARHVLVRVEVELLLLVQHGQRAGRLVRDVVGRHVQRGVRLAADHRGDLVVRGPLLVRDRRLDGQQDHHDHGRRVLPPPGRPSQQQDQAAGRDHAPGHRGQFQEGQQGEDRSAQDAAENVQPVGLERLERHEQPGHGLAEPGHHRRAQHEDHCQADRAGERLGAEQALIRVRAGQGGQDDREGQHERDQQDHRQRGPAHEVPVGLGVQEAEANAEEAGQQHEVSGVGDVDVVRRRPPDQGQFDKQHEEAGESQLRRSIQPPAAGARGPVGRGVPGDSGVGGTSAGRTIGAGASGGGAVSSGAVPGCGTAPGRGAVPGGTGHMRRIGGFGLLGYAFRALIKGHRSPIVRGAQRPGRAIGEIFPPNPLLIWGISTALALPLPYCCHLTGPRPPPGPAPAPAAPGRTRRPARRRTAPRPRPWSGRRRPASPG